MREITIKYHSDQRKHKWELVDQPRQLVVLTKSMISLEGENMQTQYTKFGYRIDWYLHDYKLAKQIDENGHSE